MTNMPTPPANQQARTGIWLSDHRAADSHVAFRGSFTLEASATVTIEIFAASWWEAHVDGTWINEGAPRYHPSRPEHAVHQIQLAPGRHVLAIHAHHYGVHTRLQRDLPAFVHCRISADGMERPTSWRAIHLACYHSQVSRINPQLGWIDWMDSRHEPVGWRDPGFQDGEWLVPAPSEAELPASRATTLTLQGRELITLAVRQQGSLHDTFGYERDDPAARFLLRQLAPTLPAQGVWRRYDLGRVRLGRPVFTLELPAGAVVEWAMCEQLHMDRVNPFITLSAGRSCNFDHVVAHGGRQVFSASAAKGGRYLEVHVLAPVDQIQVIAESFHERAYFAAQLGSFRCSDERLNTIWNLGVATLRSCSEDAVCDNPTRERGQWTGDALIGLETAAVAFGDYRLARRALEQAAIDARPDGLVSGLSPADSLGVTTYAMQWVGACLRYHDVSGDVSLLQELAGYAQRNMAALKAGEDEQGLRDQVGWGFVDWGYARPTLPVDLALNIHYLVAIRGLGTWLERLGQPTQALVHHEHAASLQQRLQGHLSVITDAEGGWQRAGYHVTALALRYGLVSAPQRVVAIAYLKQHLLSCFPNDPQAPRLSDPSVSESRLITPYFAHYALAALAESGDMDFVCEQYRQCWGWMLDLGATTCLEVFDPRWSHCHQWSACPTWQLSRYVLGIERCAQHGRNHLRVHCPLGSLPSAEGVIPLHAGAVTVAWHRRNRGIAYHLSTTVPVVLHCDQHQHSITGEWRHEFAS